MNKLYRSSIIFILFLISCNAQSQVSTKYPTLINEAELLITDSLFSEALVKYKAAFSQNPIATTTDYYNAAVCAMLTGNDKLALSYLSNLKYKGIALEKIQGKVVFQPLVDSKRWKQFQKQYLSNSSKVRNRINESYKDTLLAMMESDQYYHKKRAEHVSRKSDPELIAAYTDSAEYITHQNMDAFLSLVARNGFPSEQVVGATSFGPMILYSGLLRHAAQRKRNDFLPVLLKAVEEGKLSPHVYAYHMEEFESNMYGTTVLKGSAREMNDIPFAGLEEGAINQRRAALGMESLAELRKKARFSLKDNRFYINKPNSTVRFFESREEMIQYQKENSL
jgi:hypothetical protein